MPLTRSIFANLPQHLQDSDLEGTLEFLVDAVQVDLDAAYARIDTEPAIYDVDFTPADLQDWLGQLVGLGTIGEKYLGLGLSSTWSYQQKRDLIEAAWIYWQILGTPLGVRTAAQLWLNWAEAIDENTLEIIYPFGDRPTHELPSWWNWTTGYGHNHLRTYPRRKSWGNGANPGRWYQPVFSYSGATDRTPNLLRPSGQIQGLGAGLGPNHPWLHARLDLTNWNRVIPDLVDLAPEILHATIEPEVFGWLDFTNQDGDITSQSGDILVARVDPQLICDVEEIPFIPAEALAQAAGDPLYLSTDPEFLAATVSNFTTAGSSSATIRDLCYLTGDSLFDRYPLLRLAGNADNWQLKLVTTEGIYLVRPLVIFSYQKDWRFFDNRNVYFSFTEGLDRVYLEFVFKPELRIQTPLLASQPAQILSLDLILAGQIVTAIPLTTPLNFDRRHQIGMRFTNQFRPDDTIPLAVSSDLTLAGKPRIVTTTTTFDPLAPTVVSLLVKGQIAIATAITASPLSNENYVSHVTRLSIATTSNAIPQRVVSAVVRLQISTLTRIVPAAATSNLMAIVTNRISITSTITTGFDLAIRPTIDILTNAIDPVSTILVNARPTIDITSTVDEPPSQVNSIFRPTIDITWTVDEPPSQVSSIFRPVIDITWTVNVPVTQVDLNVRPTILTDTATVN